MEIKNEVLINVDVNDITESGTLVVPDGVQEIHFAGNIEDFGVKRVVLPESCVTIGNLSFYGWKELKEINLEYVENIEAKAFESAGLTEVRMNKVKRIEYFAFKDCANLRSVIIDNRDTELRIREHSFESCDELEHVDIYRAKLEAGVFFFCLNLKEIYLHFGNIPLVSDAFKNSPKFNCLRTDDDIRKFVVYTGSNKKVSVIGKNNSLEYLSVDYIAGFIINDVVNNEDYLIYTGNTVIWSSEENMEYVEEYFEMSSPEEIYEKYRFAVQHKSGGDIFVAKNIDEVKRIIG